MADDVLLLDEFTRFLSELPPLYERLRSNQFTQALEVADDMLTAAEQTCHCCVLFLFLFECREDEISRQIEVNLQELLGEYEQFVRRFRDVIQVCQEQETDNRFRCENESIMNEEGARGRPRFHISEVQIEGLRELGFSWTKIAGMIGVSRVTLYRRRRQLGIEEENNYSEITDVELDAVIQSVVQLSPNSGEVMMRGALLGRGLRIQRRRIRESMSRVDPVGTECRKRLRIRRRVYNVPGPNSLWHIDGNHKLIRWRIVIHGGIDGFSRTIVYLGCHTNNHAATVMNMFANAVQQFHVPYRVRCDHGTENVEVAKWMLHHHATVSNPVLTGRSVHNQRIERLWRDATQSFIGLYRRLFYFMESHQLLDPLDEVHIYALHFVYLPRIQRSVEEFILEWNNHPVSSEQNRTPFQVWTEGFYHHANSNQQPVRVALEDEHISPINYGVDDNGPLPELQTNNHVTVPRSSIQLTDEQRIALLLSINPLNNDHNYGIDIFIHTVQTLIDILQ